MAKPTDWETTAIDKRVCYLQIPREKGMPQHTGPHGEAQVSVRRQRKEGGMWARAIIVVSVERYRQGRVGGFRIG